MQILAKITQCLAILTLFIYEMKGLIHIYLINFNYHLGYGNQSYIYINI